MGDKKNPQTKTDDIFITDLTITHVRHLKNIHIPLSKDERKHLILTGKNGSGKTSVLKTVKEFLGAWQISDVLLPRGLPVKEEPELVKVTFNSRKQMRRLYSLGKYLLSFYAATRLSNLLTPKGLNKIEHKKKYTFDDHPGKEFVQYMVNLKAEKSFARDDNDKETVKKIDSWFDTIENFFKDIFEDSTLRLEFDRTNYNYKIIQKGREPFDFSTLADGYSAIINIVSDIILMMGKGREKSYDVQGVVLIDELEAHLHIDLQKKIFPFLTRFFPRIQFIISTHSPFVLNSIENAVVFDLEKKLQVNDLSKYSYDGIVESYFGNDKYSQEIKEKIKKYEELVNKPERTDIEHNEMMELRMYLSEIPADLALELKVKFQQIELNRIGGSND